MEPENKKIPLKELYERLVKFKSSEMFRSLDYCDEILGCELKNFGDKSLSQMEIERRIAARCTRVALNADTSLEAYEVKYFFEEKSTVGIEAVDKRVKALVKILGFIYKLNWDILTEKVFTDEDFPQRIIEARILKNKAILLLDSILLYIETHYYI